MGRKKGFDERKIRKIVSILAASQDGIWLRRIAKEASLSPTTVAKYLEGPIAPLLEDVSLGTGGKPILRVVRLKTLVIDRLQQGDDLRKIMRLLKLMDKVSS